jgi:hypothetical protein
VTSTLIGRTLETVLSERQCRVIIESLPEGEMRPNAVPVRPAARPAA